MDRLKRERDPNCFILAQGPAPMFHSGPGLQAFQTVNLGRKKPTIRCLGSIKAECAPQRDAVFAQRGPLFLERIRGSGKTPLLLVRKSCFPRGCRARLSAKTLPVSFPEEGFVVQTSKLLKHPATPRRKNPSPCFGFAWHCKCRQTRGRNGPVEYFWYQHLAIICSKASECFPQDQNIKFVLDKCA